MEHFEKPERATAEVSRVLVPGGHYLSLIHTDMTARDRLGLKVREFLYPRPRPVAFAAWIRKKLWHPIVQPFRKSYSVESARRCLEGGGLAVTQVITRETQPSAPLAGSHVVIFVAQKPALPAAVPAS
jgi:ubiquinone/menaquinone biosynthesis C-methylase UbiE